MDSIDDFRKRLKEIDILVCYARHNAKDITKYQIFNKVAIILLITKFEVFVESFMDEHSRKVLEQHTNMTFPMSVKGHYIETAIARAYEKKTVDKKEEIIKNLLCLYSSKEEKLLSLIGIRPKLTFSLGKHGQNELEEMFKCHGMERFIKSSEVLPLLEKINSMIAIRNNIIHEDATPSLTHIDVEQYQQALIKLIDLLEKDIKQNAQEYYNKG